jgi:hypothetical protein
LQEIVKTIVENGGMASTVCFDITDKDATQKELDKILNQGTIQILVHKNLICSKKK